MVLFQTIQFTISIQFQTAKTVLFPTIQFSISTQFSSILPIDRTLPLLARVGPGVIAMKDYSVVPKAPALLKPHHQTI